MKANESELNALKANESRERKRARLLDRRGRGPSAVVFCRPFERREQEEEDQVASPTDNRPQSGAGNRLRVSSLEPVEKHFTQNYAPSRASPFIASSTSNFFRRPPRARSPSSLESLVAGHTESSIAVAVEYTNI